MHGGTGPTPVVHHAALYRSLAPPVSLRCMRVPGPMSFVDVRSNSLLPVLPGPIADIPDRGPTDVSEPASVVLLTPGSLAALVLRVRRDRMT